MVHWACRVQRHVGLGRLLDAQDSPRSSVSQPQQPVCPVLLWTMAGAYDTCDMVLCRENHRSDDERQMTQNYQKTFYNDDMMLLVIKERRTVVIIAIYFLSHFSISALSFPLLLFQDLQ